MAPSMNQFRSLDCSWRGFQIDNHQFATPSQKQFPSFREKLWKVARYPYLNAGSSVLVQFFQEFISSSYSVIYCVLYYIHYNLANQIDLFHPRMTNENATVITEKLEKVQLPQKRYYRQRAHSNPLAHHTFDYPTRPSNQVWDEKYPQRGDREVEILDIGCGYGGLLIQLSKHFPKSLLLGLEIRVKVKTIKLEPNS